MERDAERHPEVFECADLGIAASAEHCADGGRLCQQRTGLVCLHGDAFVEGRGVAPVERNILCLASNHGRGRLDQTSGCGCAVGSAVIVEKYFECQCMHGVANNDAFADAEHIPHRCPMAPGAVVVHDVVVDQREVVDEFHGYSTGNCGVWQPVHCFCSEHRQSRSHPFAAPCVGRIAILVRPAKVIGHWQAKVFIKRIDRGPQCWFDEEFGSIERRWGHRVHVMSRR